MDERSDVILCARFSAPPITETTPIVFLTLPREVFGFERIHTTREGRQNGVEKRGWRLAHALATG